MRAYVVSRRAQTALVVFLSLTAVFAMVRLSGDPVLLFMPADVQLSFPFILLAMTINAIVGLGLRNIILSLSAAGWVVYARVVRGEVLSVKQRDYVQAAALRDTMDPKLRV